MRISALYAFACFALFLGPTACDDSAGPDKEGPPTCPAATAPVDAGAGVESQDCPIGDLCEDGTCRWMNACTEDCQCSTTVTCDEVGGRCNLPSGTLCAQCDAACTGTGLACKNVNGEPFCATTCNSPWLKMPT